MKHFLLTILGIAMLAPASVFSQTTKLQGLVFDAETQTPLPFAHVWVLDTENGTTTGRDGTFTLPMKPGSYRIKASYIGYTSRTVTVTVGRAADSIGIGLKPSTIEFPEIVVLPGENPAIPIIRKAIEARKRVEEKLQNYSLEAHSKLTMKMDVDTDSKEAAFFRETPIVLESQTDAYWSREYGYKEVIHARKQSILQNMNNFITSMPAQANFSKDEFTSNLGTMILPISESGLNSYYYELKGTIAQDSAKIYVIDVEPRSDLQPRIRGTYYIQDSTYLVNKVDVEFNRVSMPTGFEKFSFNQQFQFIEREFWMPSDVAISLEAEFNTVFTIKVDADFFSILQNHRINDPEIDTVFDDFRIVIEEGADDVDSLQWAQASLIQNTEAELRSYQVTDSVVTVEREQAKELGAMGVLFGKALEFDEQTWHVPGAFSIYRFNRIEGHALYAPVRVDNLAEPFRRIWVEPGYGFSDEKFKWDAGISLNLQKRNHIRLSLQGYDKLWYIDVEDMPLDATSATVWDALFDFDPRDYYYVRGGKASLEGYSLSWLHTMLTGGYNDYTNALVTTDERLLRANRPYPENPAINEGEISSFGLSFQYDNRDLILNKGVVERRGNRDHMPKIGAMYHSASLDEGSWDYIVASFHMRGRISTFVPGVTHYSLAGRWSDSKLPIQHVFHLTGSEGSLTRAFTFRTLRFREYGGDQTASLHLEHNFGNLPFRLLGLDELPVVQSGMWELILFGGAGWSDMRSSTAELLTYPDTETARSPFYEAGVSLNNLWGLLRLDFAWRLNKFREGNNFFFGITTSLGGMFNRDDED